MTVIDLKKVIGKGYGSFFRFKGRYRIVKGGRGSKKSCTAALYYIIMMMKMPEANTLVVRRYFNTHKDSTFAQLKWAINRLGVRSKWKVSNTPMELTYIPTGQKILFRGLDDPDSVTSITVEKGVLCWVWIEEAFQITDEHSFNKLDMSIRGEVPEGYFKQITMTFNPWSDKIWIKRRFFDEGKDDPNIFAITTNYMINEFLDEADKNLFEYIRKHNPRRYKIEGLGEWGVSEGLVYENWREEEFNVYDILKQLDNKGRPIYKRCFGLDFGFSVDPAAVSAMLISPKEKRIYVYDEIYMHRATNEDLANAIKYKGWHNSIIKADSAEPKSIQDLKKYGISKAKGCKKGADSIRNGVRRLQDYTIIVHPQHCPNHIIEMNNYTWATKDGVVLAKPIDDYNHLMDCMRYGSEGCDVESFSW